MAGDLPDDPPIDPVPTPTPTPTPDPAPAGRTIGDLIDADEAAERRKAEATDAVSAANETLKAATEEAERTDDEAAAGLNRTGEVFRVLDDGSGNARVYTADGADSYTSRLVKPTSTPVGGA